MLAMVPAWDGRDEIKKDNITRNRLVEAKIILFFEIFITNNRINTARVNCNN